VWSGKLGDRELLFEMHRSSGRRLMPRLAVLGGQPDQPRLTRLYAVSFEGDDDITALEDVCRAEPDGDGLTILYRGQGSSRLKTKLKVTLRRVKACPASQPATAPTRTPAP
jgi:hypothetical protein